MCARRSSTGWRCAVRTSAGCVCALAVAAGLMVQTGCGGGGGARGGSRAQDAGEVNTGLNALGSNASADISSGMGVQLPDPRQPMNDREKAAWAQQSALNLERLLAGAGGEGTAGEGAGGAVAGGETGPPAGATDSGQAAAQESGATEMARTQPPATEPPAPEVPDLPDLPEQTESSGLASLAGGAAGEGGGEVTDAGEVTPAAEPEPTPEAARTPTLGADHPDAALVDLAAKMATLLRQRNADGGTGRGADTLRNDSTALAPIEAMRAGTLATLDDPAGVLARHLSEEDLGLLRAARDRVLAQPARAQPELVRALRGIGGSGSLSITRTALCLRVEGFGRFEPFASTTFLAGRPVRAIVYAELEDFEARPAREGDPTLRGVPITEQVSVDLTQSISLFHDRDGLLAWHRPARAVVETGRSKRRDFYTIQIIDLPATLSVGRYNLVVTIADRTSGSEAQASIPIEVVADPTLVRAAE